ncbi:hypothetical protein GOP47_0006282 [Adiantum capillus-veneris]|uniref:DUF1997 family protein n=1 Tax=Adiantum capillus-veneris TaxID=13818 RepID=A0A9D4ZMC8_ADICA|nr:hypothetical protein GOP47_0006282 [Adiantum capillus-veneris]
MALASTFLTPCAESTKDIQFVTGHANEQSCYFTFDQSKPSVRKHSSLRIFYQLQNNEKTPSKKKVAHLKVQQNQILPLPTHRSTLGAPRPLCDFLSQRAGMESMLNVNALQSHEYIGSNIFRCTLPKLEILNFEVAPVVDLSVVANEQECVVEMLSCKFQGSEVVESQNERFSASMRNQLTWDSKNGNGQVLEVNVELNVALEVYTLPFTLLPISAVETPGNVILQAMVDRMVPLFIEHLLDDYYRWSQTSDDLQAPAEELLCEKSSS